MKRLLFVIIIIVIIGGLLYFFVFKKTKPISITPPSPQTQIREPITITGIMTISSSAFTRRPSKEGEELVIPNKYTCDGENVNPPLQISGIPANAKSLVLIVDDPDAPRGTWVHWTLWNINPEATHILENRVPQGAVEGTTDFGRTGWGGPCPPSGTHRYFFKIYALDTTLDLLSSARKSDLETAMQGHILDQAELIGLYKRS